MHTFNPQPILQNEQVLIRPLQQEDFDELFLIAADPGLWEQHPAKERSTTEGFARFFDDALATGMALAITDRQAGKVIGTSRYNTYPGSDRAIEIGWTFIARPLWGGHWNKQVKHLMLTHAFNHFEAVLFYIHKDNFRSQKAVKKIGASQAATVFQKPIIFRDTVTLVYALYKEDFTKQQAASSNDISE